MKESTKNVIYFIAFFVAFIAALEIPTYIHAAKCKGCSWYWCANQK